ncbi:hypothetical protein PAPPERLAPAPP_03150 [Brevundimonas phage vB_BpoS-Papperlapapp]|uniref:Uncharacterized protein n=1 Tax=Brevundimonas phage vB_BpoS-Domovoi TaxID=2948598 RepID=A0A9E7MQQ6_9CAUD|nr:hypothetical protein DOMOVOI_02100 [Brevundimonas phage vB_BpoS-Domovoi]USN16056.1 hypothetical protein PAPPERLAPAPP_03150 [Brevundimonas phage vB_BpoS-Papperlapapp]
MLTHDLTKHLDDAEHFTVADQSIKVGVMKGPNDHILAIMVIEDIVTEGEARWLGDRIKEDVLTWVRTGVPEAGDGVVTAEIKADKDRWRLGVYTFHATLEDASLVSAFMNQYAAVTQPIVPAPDVVQ